MAAIDDYILAGFPFPKAQTLANLSSVYDPTDATTQANTRRTCEANLVSVGFSPVQASLIMDAYTGTNDVAALATSGLWSGTEVAALNANL